MRTKSCRHTWVSVLVPKSVVTLSAYSMVAANPLPTVWRKESGGGGFGQPPPNVAFAFTMYPAGQSRVQSLLSASMCGSPSVRCSVATIPGACMLVRQPACPVRNLLSACCCYRFWGRMSATDRDFINSSSAHFWKGRGAHQCSLLWPVTGCVPSPAAPAVRSPHSK